MKQCRICGQEFPLEQHPPYRRICPVCRRAQITARILRQRAINRTYITEVNARTFCAHCGRQPIEWHNAEHAELNRHDRRVGYMVSRGSSIDAIAAEIATCTPLCLPCHRKEDGRIEKMVRAQKRTRNTAPCSDCGAPYFPLRRGLCHACNEYQRYASTPRRPYLESIGRVG
jgi:hypothetical protein